MTYALAWPLQQAVYQLLTSTAAVTAILGQEIHDAMPQAGPDPAEPGVWAVIGDETARDWSTADGAGAAHEISIFVYAPATGFAAAKQAAGAISDALLGGMLVLSRGRVISTQFVSARTRREEKGALRRIELRFRILAEDTL